MSRKFDVGAVFTNLTVLSRTSQEAICRCVCGKIVTVRTSNLLRNATKSCGCLNKSRDHGLCKTLSYQSWMCMRVRCKDKDNKNYGGKGIAVCERWDKSFLAFLADMGERPSKSHTLERIDGSRNYEPGNVKWATKAEQSANRNVNRLIMYNGKTDFVSSWARSYGIHIQTLFRRIYQGWSTERALTTPVRK